MARKKDAENDSTGDLGKMSSGMNDRELASTCGELAEEKDDLKNAKGRDTT